jgi:hypothetical protein
MGGGSADDACEIDLDERSIIFRRPRPAGSIAPEVDQQPAPAPVPVPANGCAWAGRSFSDGAGFCITDRFMQICAAGKWVREPATEGCHGALADTK